MDLFLVLSKECGCGRQHPDRGCPCRSQDKEPERILHCEKGCSSKGSRAQPAIPSVPTHSSVAVGSLSGRLQDGKHVGRLDVGRWMLDVGCWLTALELSLGSRADRKIYDTGPQRPPPRSRPILNNSSILDFYGSLCFVKPHKNTVRHRHSNQTVQAQHRWSCSGLKVEDDRTSLDVRREEKKLCSTRTSRASRWTRFTSTSHVYNGYNTIGPKSAPKTWRPCWRASTPSHQALKHAALVCSSPQCDDDHGVEWRPLVICHESVPWASSSSSGVSCYGP